MNSKDTWHVPPASTWSEHWTHHNLKLFDHAPQDLFVKSAVTNTMNEWNRQIKAQEKCVYFINGVQLSTLRQEPFEHLEDFKAFLKEKLFPSQSTDDQKQLVEMILATGYQGGLFYATNSAMTKKSMPTSVGLSQADIRIDLISDPEGLKIMEENKYRQWVETSTGEKHICKENKPYYLKTQTTYVMKADSIKLCDLVVDCPSRHLAPIFDDRPQEEQIFRSPLFKSLVAYIIAALCGMAGFQNTPSKEEETIYPKPTKL